MNAIGRRMKFTTADEPSPERMSDAVATPIAAKAAAPNTTASASEPIACGNGVPYSTLPSTKSATACNAKTSSVDASSAAM